MNLGLKYVAGPDGTKILTIPEENRAMVQAFLRDNGVKSPNEIESIVQQGHDELCAALAGVSDAQARYKPAPDDWSVLELMAHVVTTKQVVVGLARSLADGHWPPGVTDESQEPQRQDGVTFRTFGTLAEARAASQAAHDDLLAFIRGLDGPVNTDIRFRHFVFGDLNAREWAVFQRIHDGDHTPQIGSIKASPAFPME